MGVDISINGVLSDGIVLERIEIKETIVEYKMGIVVCYFQLLLYNVDA